MTSVLAPDAQLGADVEIQEFCVIGTLPRKVEAPTRIGARSVIRSHTVIYRGNETGEGFQTGHGAMVRERNRIGANVSVGTNSIVERDNVIEDDVRIHSACFIPEFITIKRGAWIGPRVTVLNAMHPPCPEFDKCGRGIAAPGVDAPRVHAVVIGENAKIGGGVTIGPWVRIGKNALVGAGSVVVSDVPDDAVVTGNPARVVKRVDELACAAGYFKTPYEWEEKA